MQELCRSRSERVRALCRELSPCGRLHAGTAPGILPAQKPFFRMASLRDEAAVFGLYSSAALAARCLSKIPLFARKNAVFPLSFGRGRCAAS